ncbi:MAG TPA: hypothetical protein VF452_18255, partial [Candidatus Binatia bacterium]
MQAPIRARHAGSRFLYSGQPFGEGEDSPTTIRQSCAIDPNLLRLAILRRASAISRLSSATLSLIAA